MAPSFGGLQLTPFAAGGRKPSPDDDGEDLEDVWLLDGYDEDGSGLEEGMRRIQVRVTGMTCAACSNSVEGALRDVNGVLRASVALLQNRADVVFDPKFVGVSAILFCFCNLCFLWNLCRDCVIYI